MSVPELPTRAYLSNGSPAPSGVRKKRTHCPVDGKLAGGSQFAAELTALLRRRLRFVALMAWLAAVLWLPRPMTLCTLRKMELALFGSLGAFFGFLQAQIFANTSLFDAASCVIERGQAVQVIRLWIDSTAARWVFLIV